MKIRQKFMAYLLSVAMVISAVPFNANVVFANPPTTVPDPSVRFAVVEDGGQYKFKETTDNGITLDVMNGTTKQPGATETIVDNIAAQMGGVYYQADNHSVFDFPKDQSFTISVLLKEPEGNAMDYIVTKKNPPVVPGKTLYHFDSLWHIGNYSNGLRQYGFRNGS